MSGLFIAVVAGAVLLAPACTVKDKCGDTDPDTDDCASMGGSGNEGGAGTGGLATGGSAMGGAATGGAPDAGAGGQQTGGTPSEGGSAGLGGAGGQGAAPSTDAGAGGDGGAGGAAGKVCTAPPSGQESAQGQTCADYCSDFFTNCAAYNTANATFVSESVCRMECEFYLDAQLCCRAFHALSAATTVADCEQAAGDDTCN